MTIFSFNKINLLINILKNFIYEIKNKIYIRMDAVCCNLESSSRIGFQCRYGCLKAGFAKAAHSAGRYGHCRRLRRYRAGTV
ncbi:hypothetical protein NEILACOT_04957 [Neisseria lactamica ATCC 23970]|uniref:Uncharacterized protein n=1 Tax=Neisseria lactamica ATCC 23970 TaxID=546265 RepID=D0WBN0_NEILA|nr:hypothetical protein NEILACOT_04957 [Neisseria lactamica ATCC 23970]